MSQVSRVVTTWTGTPVIGGGATVMHCTVGDEHALMTAFRAMLDSIKASFPTGIQWTWPSAGTILTQENGELSGSWSDSSPPAALSSTGGALYAAGVGARVKWTTGAYYHGHQVVGSTFLVPITTANYEGAGNIDGTVLALWNSAVATFVAAAGLRIYSRPSSEGDGQSFAVNGGSVPDYVSWIRSRRV